MLKRVKIGEKRELVVPGNYAETLQFCVQHWIKVAQTSIEERGSFAVALSGGSTPKAIYESLALPENAKKIDWSKVYLFWSDERTVGPDHPESNYHMAMQAGFAKLPIPQDQIFRMQAEKSLEMEAERYEKIIGDQLQDRPFDLIMLGMGDDGHTASLFPHTAGLQVRDRLVIANEIPQKQCWRMTMTFACINQALHNAIYVLGSSKKEMLAEVLSSNKDVERLPSQGVGTKEHPAIWIADSAAAALFLSRSSH
ncbi:MAG: 6-phosphogluconolactonase [Chlamydiales bacterium]|nr:6-phosphogluconolactonase [Chlamydiales bacterium]